MGLRPHVTLRRALAQAVGALLTLTALLLPGMAFAQTFPALTGPVVDQANIIPDDVEARITGKLTAIKTQSQRQLQVDSVGEEKET